MSFKSGNFHQNDAKIGDKLTDNAINRGGNLEFDEGKVGNMMAYVGYDVKFVYYITCLAAIDNISEFALALSKFNITAIEEIRELKKILLDRVNVTESVQIKHVLSNFILQDASITAITSYHHCEDILFPPACKHHKPCAKRYLDHDHNNHININYNNNNNNFTATSLIRPSIDFPVFYLHVSKCAGKYFFKYAQIYEKNSAEFACYRANRYMLYKKLLQLSCRANDLESMLSVFTDSRKKLTLAGAESGYRFVLAAPEPLLFSKHFFLMTRLREPISLMISARNYFGKSYANSTLFFLRDHWGVKFHDIYVRTFSGKLPVLTSDRVFRTTLGQFKSNAANIGNGKSKSSIISNGILTENEFEIAKLHISHYNLILVGECDNFFDIMRERLLWKIPKNTKDIDFHVTRREYKLTTDEMEYMNSQTQWDRRFYQYLLDNNLSPCHDKL